MTDPRKWHRMECPIPTCQAEVFVHETTDLATCPECGQRCEVSWDGAPDGGSGLVALSESDHAEG